MTFNKFTIQKNFSISAAVAAARPTLQSGYAMLMIGYGNLTNSTTLSKIVIPKQLPEYRNENDHIEIG